MTATDVSQHNLEIHLKDMSIFQKKKVFTLVCRLLKPVVLSTSQNTGKPYISCHIVDVRYIPLFQFRSVVRMSHNRLQMTQS